MVFAIPFKIPLEVNSQLEDNRRRFICKSIEETRINKNPVFHYTVSDLIDILSSSPLDFPILTSGYENGFDNIQQPVLKDLVRKGL